MIKRLLSAALCLFVLISITGCASILEGETSEITPYFAVGGASASSNTVEVSTYEDFKAAVTEMVKNHTDSANFKIISFDRDNIEESLNEICRNLSSLDPLCSYAAYYISCQITPIVGYLDVTVSIVYKKEAEEIAAISTVSTDRYLQILLNSAMSEHADVFAFYTELSDATSEYIHNTVNEYYYASPLDVVIRPEITVTAYPSPDGERIMEVTFNYNNYTQSVLNNMRNNLNDEVQRIIGELPDGDDFTLISAIYTLLGERTVNPVPATKLAATAYSVVLNNTGTSEGYAMAFKALCDKLLIDCQVISGKLDGEVHYWNIVTFEGVSYHIDITAAKTEFPIFLCSDEYIREHYWWDTSTVPECPANMSIAPNPVSSETQS